MIESLQVSSSIKNYISDRVSLIYMRCTYMHILLDFATSSTPSSPLLCNWYANDRAWTTCHLSLSPCSDPDVT